MSPRTFSRSHCLQSCQLLCDLPCRCWHSACTHPPRRSCLSHSSFSMLPPTYALLMQDIARVSADRSGSVASVARAAGGRSGKQDATLQSRMAASALSDADLVPYHRSPSRTTQARPQAPLSLHLSMNLHTDPCAGAASCAYLDCAPTSNGSVTVSTSAGPRASKTTPLAF